MRIVALAGLDPPGVSLAQVHPENNTVEAGRQSTKEVGRLAIKPKVHAFDK